MKEQLVTYSTAVLAKEKGFDWCTMLAYTDAISQPLVGISKHNNSKYATLSDEDYPYNTAITAPTQSLLQRWLREEHEIDVYIMPSDQGYFTNIEYIDDDGEVVDIEIPIEGTHHIKHFETYEQALEEGLQEALKLIK